MFQHTNRLIKESSPYLLQHAHNPVDWHPWSEEAFEKAEKEDKPVLVSIGYAACHWCHVMERESFENEEVASLMNQNFINIKVDREERPDVDHIYMDAVQAMTGSGGWPLHVFLTPDRKPFFGGTYFPPSKAFNRSSWTEILLYISKTYSERKEEVEKQAQTLTEHIKASNAFGTVLQEEAVFQQSKVEEAFQQVMKTADRDWGGFGKAPKFPQTFTINFLLQYGFTRKNKEALEQALLSLDKMIEGGIYDQIGGGFARYSTDTEWLAPHFEKMLYDNALLVSTLSDALMISKKPAYEDVIRQTLSFVERELMHPQGGFFSAIDADSEGEEGKFYVWQYTEIVDLLQEDAALFCAYFDITSTGNWENKNIPRILQPIEKFAADRNIKTEVVATIIEKGRKILMEAREKRVRPQLDDKVILGWNALISIAFSKAYAATGDIHYKELAIHHMDFLLSVFQGEKGLLHHTWKNGKATYPAFLDDYSNLIAALLEILQITGELRYLDSAKAFTQTVIEYFENEETALFFFTNKEQKDIPLRKIEIYDGASPAGNSVMAYNLYRLSILLDYPDWRKKAEKMVRSLSGVISKYPTSFGVWMCLLFEMIHGTSEVVLIGNKAHAYLGTILGIFISHKVVLASDKSLPGYPLLANKSANSEILIYLCENYACHPPVNSVEGFLGLIEHNNFK